MSFLNQILQGNTLFPLLFVVGLGVLACLFAYFDEQTLLSQIAANDKRFPTALSEAEAKGPGVRGASKLLFPIVALLEPAPDDGPALNGRRLVSGDVAETYAESCAAALGTTSLPSRALNAAGHGLTGIALIFTFGFIAYVLAEDVPKAIQDVSDASGGTGNVALRSAVALIGAKFLVSAAGLLFSLIFRWVESAMRKEVFHAALRSAYKNRGAFVAEDAYRFEVVARRSGRLDQRLETMIDGIGALNEHVSRLGSIEVSVTALGNEVVAHVGTLMKQNVADQICDALDEIRVSTEMLMEKVKADLAQAFLSTTTEQSKQLTDGLESVRATIADQSKSDVGKLVEQMKDMMSGGFNSASGNMVEAMGSLSAVLPKLEEQMRHMTEDVGRDMRERSEANGKMQSDLMTQLRETMNASQESQVQSRAALARIVEASEQSAGTLHDKISESGQRAINELMELSGKGLGRVSDQLSSLNSLASGSVSAFGKEIANAAGTFEEARKSLTLSVLSMKALSNELHASLGGTTKALEHSSAAFQRFDQASSNMGGASTQIGTAVTALAGWVGKEQQLLVQQKELAERVLPKVMTDYISMLDGQSKRIESSWTELAKNVERTVNGAGSEFASNVEALVEQVEILKSSLEKTSLVRR